MSGHSKWSQIKHKKAASDQKRGQAFSKLAKKISIAAREGANPATNYKLQAIIDEARSFNMPKDNIERAIKRAGEKENMALDEITIQAIGPASVALVIKGVTDNKNRTIGEIKNILSKNGAKMVPENSLNWIFNKNDEPVAPLEITDQLILEKINKLLEELDDQDDVGEVYSNLK
jgi:YebC/PmpR family DNA-binding regulatory protein